ncbi:hypothetical protein [Rhodopirellula baltica]|uniref:hypothetical protein n=1 Tax=Rhodopirellula baltica TaxID=265606 RepID=UPI000302A4DA|nr:hypothetical protein [Rhodopirellula baltica]
MIPVALVLLAYCTLPISRSPVVHPQRLSQLRTPPVKRSVATVARWDPSEWCVSALESCVAR